MRHPTTFLCASALALAASAQPAFAQDEAQINGAAGASVVTPSRVTRIADLRFGAFMRPATASTIRVTVDGSVVPSSGVAGGMGVDQPPEGRGPAQFRIEQSRSLLFIAYYPQQVVITNGSANMTVNNTTARLVRTTQQGVNSIWRLDMGGTLNINANQQSGQYSGDFIITVAYL